MYLLIHIKRDWLILTYFIKEINSSVEGGVEGGA